MSEPSSLNFTEASTSRYKLLERPVALPGRCVTCGAVDRPVVDTNWNIDMFGAVYFCVSCLAEVARVIGMVPALEVQEAEANSAKAFHDYLVKHNLKVVGNEQFQYWADTLSNLSFDLTRGSHVPDVSVDEQATLPKPTADKDVSGTAKQKSKSAVSKGPAIVPDGSVDGKSTFNF
jgi:hypothetical protein